jgi:hypothetical protein
MEERCPTDERHCTCVPMLRGEVERLRAGKHDRLEEARLTKQLMEAKQQRDQCRRLLREACKMPPRLGDTGLVHTVTGDWLRRAAAAAGGGDG